MEAQENQVALPLRSHTILGVCEAIGEDFGFNPIFLRIPLAASVIWNPMIAFGTYFALGAVVLISRLLFPKSKASAPAQTAPAVVSEEPELRKAA
jgi:phage shock protein PspC (stress-responsive transcriptional regulator)